MSDNCLLHRIMTRGYNTRNKKVKTSQESLDELEQITLESGVSMLVANHNDWSSLVDIMYLVAFQR